MGLEAGNGFISGLVATNPVGATDPKSQGDDHLRLIKAAVLGSFPNLGAAAVTSSATELNYTDGVTGVEGTGKIVLAASGVLPALSGVNLTALAAANITAGGTLPALNGAALTSLNATNLASGSVADARLSANVPLLNAANTFTASASGVSFPASFSSTVPGNLYRETAAAANAQVWRNYITGGVQLWDIASDAGVQQAPWMAASRSGATVSQVDLAATTLSFAGNLTTPNTSASEVGYKGGPRRNVSASDNTLATDAGKTIVFTAGSGQTFTMDADPPTDSIVYVLNKSGNNWSVAGSGSITFLGSTGTITLADKRVMTCFHDGSGNWYCH